jgi:exodeoxyribonuclease VII large subunit
VDRLFPVSAEPRRLSLVRLSTELARAVAGLGRVATEGEVVRPTVTRSGRVYFSLRDRGLQLTVTYPAERARRCRAVHGERVSVVGSTSYTTERGQVALVAEEIVPVGEGAMAAALAETRERLRAAGLLDRPRRPIPLLPALVGVVCGADAAVRADIESVVAARFPGYPVIFREVSVSGPGATERIVAAMRSLDTTPEVEVIVLARGGGDPAALFPWSDEDVCRAICGTRAPVVSAIGHERDRPLCDEVADLRSGTPSLAAATVIPDRRALADRLDGCLATCREGLSVRMASSAQRLSGVDPAGALRNGLQTATARLSRAAAVLHSVDLLARTADARRELARVEWRSPFRHLAAQAEAQLAERRRTLDALDPARVLDRGYAIVKGPDDAILRDPAKVRPGDPLEITVAGGRLGATVASGRAPA